MRTASFGTFEQPLGASQRPVGRAAATNVAWARPVRSRVPYPGKKNAIGRTKMLFDAGWAGHRTRRLTEPYGPIQSQVRRTREPATPVADPAAMLGLNCILKPRCTGRAVIWLCTLELLLGNNVADDTPITRHLTDAISCRGIAIPGAVVLAPINTGFAKDGAPDERLVTFHRMRAGLGIGIAFVGNVATTFGSRTNDGTAVLSQPHHVPRFADIAAAIGQQGTLPGIQIGDTPDWLVKTPRWRAENRNEEVKRLREHVQALSAQALSELLDRFEQTVDLAVQAKFKVIEVHAAHGYSLALLLDPDTNRRADHFASEGPWLNEFCRRMRARVGEQSLLAFRVSGFTGLRERSEDLLRTQKLWSRLSSYGADILDLSAGLYTIDRSLIYPKQIRGPANLDFVEPLSRVPGVVIVSGAIRDLDLVGRLPSNVLIGLGRPLLADPRLVDKHLSGRACDVVLCCNSGRCHFGTTGQPSIACGKNPALADTGG